MPTYRDDDSASRARLHALVEAQTRALDEVDPRARAIFVNRVSRTAGATVASLGGLAILFISSQVWILALRKGLAPLDMHNDVIEKDATLAGCILVGTLTGAALVAKTVRRSGARLFQRAIPLTSANASPREEVIRLETFSVRDAVRGLLTRVERVSILLPLIACSLLGPILLWQALGVAVSMVYLLFKLSGGGISAAVTWNVAWKFFLFFRWVVVLGGAAEVISACAMFAQIVLVGCCIRYGWKVTSTSVRAREVDPKEGGFLAYCLTIVPSFASILVIYMGGFIVGPLTFVFVPWMFRRMGTKLIAERAELAAAFAVPEPASVDVQAKD